MDRTDKLYSPIESFSPQKRDEHAWQGVQKVIADGYAASKEIKDRLDSIGAVPADFKSWDDFTKIPPLSKKKLITLQHEKGLDWLLTLSPGKLSRIYQSPGPILDPEGREADYWGWAEAFYAAGFRKDDLVQMTFSYHLTPAGLMLEEPLRQIGCAVIPAGPGNTKVQIELLTSLPVTGFVGMASYLKTIAQKAEAKGLNPKQDFKLKVAFVAAERLTDSLRSSVQETLGIKVRQGYGTADVGCIAYECDQLLGWHTSSRCHVEICDPQTGRPLPPETPGEVVVTPFVRSYPLLRLATGDLSQIVQGNCSCGRTAPRLSGIMGRVDDTAKVKGQFIYPAQVASALKAFPQIDAHQIVIENSQGRDSFTICLHTTAELDRDLLARAVQNEVKLLPVIREVKKEQLQDQPPLIDKRVFE